ncbi:glycosyltransferase family 4 protein [Synechocystis sp. LKSZ1]|uniref:MraY family glycosyltransferase n=1 Tax=Synechocystis sp. LKSZ1 TaxID=3144951 RepID=UPI00336BDAC9
MKLPFLIILLLSFSMSLLITKRVQVLALNKSLIDIPNERSSHQVPTPRGGGIGFTAAFLIILMLINWLPDINLSPNLFLFLVITPLAIVGFLDDRYNLPSGLRYTIQLASALLTVWHYGNFPQPWLDSLGIGGLLLALGLTAIGFTALVNFYNFMDGLDGFITTITTIQLSFIALFLNQPIWWLFIAALLGFLYWNWSPAKIFMGDVGSTVLGAVVAIALIQSPTTELAWSALAITLPVTADTIYTLIIRLRRGENIFLAHRSHLFQRLHQAGWSHAQVTVAYGVLTITIAALVFLGKMWGALAAVGLILLLIPVTEFYLKKVHSSVQN